MPSTGHLVAFVLAFAVLVLIPGPTVVFVVSRALAHGRRAALTSVAGNATGVAALVLLVAFGLGPVVARSLLAFTVLKLAGAAYLIYLGVRTFLERGRLAVPVRSGPAELGPSGVGRHLYRQGVLVGVTNPKALVFFAAVLPQFVDPRGGQVPVQLAALGLVFVLFGMLLDGVWALAAGTARDWLARSPGRLRVLGGTGGVAMVGLGVGLALTNRAQ